MNIFFLSWIPQEAARLHCDKHVVKMILESVQLLYSAHWMLNPENLPLNAYKLAHKNHPCSIWVRHSLNNYLWLSSLTWWLCKEYTYRYDNVHKSEEHLKWLLLNPPKSIPDVPMSLPAQAMPDEYKNKDPIKAYQTFYRESKYKKRQIVSYRKREWPEFLIKE